ncbi:Calx-beta domain-containing protein [uncultured Maribacter sp.]|uniref:DUF5074 domain-containing protein n=1 Tax=uncultured Maribacter sp. TaxID=431308 RepID=UPI00260245D8|nr:Calx-beta domain-containing protein [uncultured Maribacter sp.]
MKIKHFMLTAALASLVLSSCSEDDEQMPGTIGISTTQDSYEEGAGTIAVVITASDVYDEDVTINYEVSGTATSNEDFTALSGTAILVAGETSVEESLVLIDDEDVEPSEDLILTITSTSSLQGIIGTNNTVTLTITDNDSYPFENGILVSHEGNFGQGNASISFVSSDLENIENGIYKSVNGVDAWGDNAQSIAFNGDMAYVIMNGSQKIEVVNRYTFESVATIGGPSESDFLNPRYMAIANGKGYVTNWGDGSSTEDDYVAVINLETNTVESTISVVEGPEKIVAYNSTVYVAQQGGWGENNVVTVIDATTNTVETTITVGDRPNSLRLDADNNLWVISGGNPSWTGNETAGQMDKINTTDNTVTSTLNFAVTEHPGNLEVDGANLYYYMSGSVYEMEVTSTTLPTASEITGLSFYDMAVINGKLYGVDAKDFVSNGSLEVYDLTDNSLLASKEVSIIPGGIYYNGSAER